MKKIVLILTLFLISSTVAASKKKDNHKHKNINPIAKLKVSQKKCDSPCTVTLDGSKSIAEKGKTISKYIFDLGNGETIESTTPSIEFTYINFKEETDKIKRKKREDKYKKWEKYIQHCKKRFKSFDKFEINLQVVQPDEKSNKSAKKILLVKPSDSMPVIDGDDIIPPTPDQVLNDSTLLGIDSDNDGVRDDIEIWINNRFPDNTEMRKSFKQMARAAQHVFTVFEDKQLSIENSYIREEASTCAMANLPQDPEANDIAWAEMYRAKSEQRILIFNTKKRILANIKYNNQLGGSGRSPKVMQFEKEGKSELELCK